MDLFRPYHEILMCMLLLLEGWQICASYLGLLPSSIRSSTSSSHSRSDSECRAYFKGKDILWSRERKRGSASFILWGHPGMTSTKMSIYFWPLPPSQLILVVLPAFCKHPFSQSCCKITIWSHKKINPANDLDLFGDLDQHWWSMIFDLLNLPTDLTMRSWSWSLIYDLFDHKRS